MEMKPENLIIPVGLVQAIGDYLIKRPYAEVVQLIDALQRLQPAPQQPLDAAKAVGAVYGGGQAYP